MMTLFGIALVLALLALVALFVWRPMKSYLTYRGERIITCPESHAPAAVRVDARQAALLSNVPGAAHTLKDCSRWPERAGCDQDCLSQVEADPVATRVSEIVTRWYEGKVCALCGTRIDHLNWADRRAALMNGDGITHEWDAVPPEDLPGIFATNSPVCWSCHLAETFRGRHPELVTDRSER